MSPPTPPLQLFKKPLGIINSTYKGLQWTPLVKIQKEFSFSKSMSATTPPLHPFEKTLEITNSTYKGLQRTLLMKVEKEFSFLKKYVSNNSTTPSV